MKMRNLFLLFAGSLVAGWVLRSATSSSEPPQLVQPSATRLRPKIARTPASGERLKKFLTLTSEEQANFCKNVSPQDRAALVELMLQDGDPSGLAYASRSMIARMMKTWVEEDFTSAWAWCQQLTGVTWKRYIAGELLDRLAEKDLTLALTLHLETSAADPLFDSMVPNLAFRNAATKNASDFLDVLGRLPDHHGGSTGADFARDFDFQQAAEGVNTLLKKQKQLPPEFPHNFIETWGERDPDAAFDWLVSLGQHKIVHLNSLLEGLGKQGIPGATSTWVAGKIEESATSRNVIAQGLTQASTAMITDIQKALPSSESSDRFMTELFLQQCKFSPSNFSASLAAMSSAQVRINAFLRAKQEHHDLNQEANELKYEDFGVTRQQFEEIFPPEK
jgi:hypothetical protein